MVCCAIADTEKTSASNKAISHAFIPLNLFFSSLIFLLLYLRFALAPYTVIHGSSMTPQFSGGATAPSAATD
jgi:hypothetical protein